ncbi:hypothetical protein IL306_001993 [Fusarium sp. DS 682]|nr:hypothetical protein IL306_001993 [Fusarium sp. DS 682]
MKPSSKTKDETAPPSTSGDAAEAPSSSTGEAEQLEPLLDNKGKIPQLIGNEWKETTFYRQHGNPVGTISFLDETLKNKVLARHNKDKKSPWKDWVVEDNFKGVTVLYEATDAKVE